MALPKILLITLVALSMLLAGCHESPADDGDDPGTGGDGQEDGDDGGSGTGDGDGDTEASLSIVGDAPTTGTAGENVTLTISAEGVEGTSDHGGIHFWTESQDDDAVSASNAAGASAHNTSIELPGEYDTTWTLPEAGTYYYRAHLRVDGTDYWGPEHTIVIE